MLTRYSRKWNGRFYTSIFLKARIFLLQTISVRILVSSSTDTMPSS